MDLLNREGLLMNLIRAYGGKPKQHKVGGSLTSTQLNKKGEEMSDMISMVVDTILKTKKNGRITQVPPLSILRTFLFSNNF